MTVQSLELKSLPTEVRIASNTLNDKKSRVEIREHLQVPLKLIACSEKHMHTTIQNTTCSKQCKRLYKKAMQCLDYIMSSLMLLYSDHCFNLFNWFQFPGHHAENSSPVIICT